jgi:CheY-like chemotaxis protein
MDVRMPVQDGIEATRQIKEDDETADVKVLVLITFDLGECVYAAREVLRESRPGLSNTEIAERLHLSAATAKTHVSRLLMTLAARDRAQLGVVAYGSELARRVRRERDAASQPVLTPGDRLLRAGSQDKFVRSTKAPTRSILQPRIACPAVNE